MSGERETGHVHVALIDDDAVWRHLAAVGLESQGLTVADYGDGQSLFDDLQRGAPGFRRPDALVIDALMPVEDGFALVRRLRRQPGFERIPILMATSFEDERSIAAAFDAGVTDFWVKSFNYFLLAKRISHCVNVVTMQRALRDSEDRLAQIHSVAKTGSFECDLARRRIRTPRGGLILLGYDGAQTELPVRDFLRRIPLPARRGVRSALMNFIRSGEPFAIDFPFFSATGLSLTVEIEGCAEGGDGRSRFSRVRGLLHDVTESRSAEARIERLTQVDTLTGLPNRNRLLGEIARVMALAEGTDRQSAVAVIDLDRFTRINLSLGQQNGDDLLCRVADRLRETLTVLWPQAMLARLTGDEFAIFASDVDSVDRFEALMREAARAIARPFDVAGIDCFLSGSIGMALYPRDGMTAGSLLSRADAALLQLKRHGPGGLTWFRQTASERATAEIQMISGLHRALARDEFLLHFQPCIDLHARKLTTVEALIRWQRDGKLVPPGDFIGVAEESGMIVELGDWVIERACRQLGQWRAEGVAVPRVSVNISSRHFERPGLAETVERNMREWQLPPGSLEIELTESSVVRDFETTLEALLRLKAAGVVLALDDFGTGYSSLSYLTRLPISKLKIDRSFVRMMGVSTQGEAVVRAIIALGQSLRIETVAEGVETDAQVMRLLDLGCPVQQGFRFARPLTSDDLAAWIVSSLPEHLLRVRTAFALSEPQE